ENNIIDHTSALHILEKRRETYWYKNSEDNKLKDHYKALYQYLNFTDLYKRTSLDFKTLREGWESYTSELYQIDMAYRKFIYYYQLCSSSERFTNLLEKLDREYTEGFMQKLSLSWQQALDREKTLSGISSVKMTDFFEKHVVPYLDQDQLLFVIISDGLRYEVGAEVSDAVERQNRFKVELGSIISPVPAYTQLGMASLLPHETLAIADDGDTVFADGKTTKGLENRCKILQSYLDAKYKGKKAKAMQAREFLELPMPEQEELIKGIDLFYLYSPGIDSVGENPKTEKNLPRAAEDEIDFICDLSKKIVNLNRTHILVTADHGYLYSYNPVPETEWIKLEAQSGEIKKDHRFMIAKELSENSGADIIEQDELVWEGPFGLQTARGVSLIRRPGGGSRYVHGGRMIQEICVPLLVLKKSRTDDVSTVEISVIDRKSDITTGQVSIKFLQESPVDNKVQPREIIAVFEGEKGVELTNVRKLIFDSSNPNDQNRSRSETFIFNKYADDYNGKIINLKLYDLKSGNTKVFYKDYSYRFKKSIQSDFDF
ncbi:MAG: BREX-1 system phosphatase PglZ type A, partial [Spirochaetia bacterium]|nr:BREX-1 system phosphatase PglZ type A [Spirochaetia bacterium]